jgi:hypothetical protein
MEHEADIDERVDRHRGGGSDDNTTLQYGGELEGSPVYDDEGDIANVSSRGMVHISHVLALPPKFWVVCIGTTCFFSSGITITYTIPYRHR